VLHDLKRWLVAWADSPAGPAVLALLTASESIFFPLPTDPLLIALALRNPDAALLLALLTTVASVGGGLVGHWLGAHFGRPLLRRFHSSKVERVEAMFVRYGFWAIVIAGLTPLPYKVFTISAGVFAIPRAQFVLASFVGRGLRFGTFGVLIFLWGDRFEAFFAEQFDLVLIVLAAGLAIGLAGWLVWGRWRGARARAA
jgi:membrane protein YqaA with SNARE-associated domain